MSLLIHECASHATAPVPEVTAGGHERTVSYSLSIAYVDATAASHLKWKDLEALDAEKPHQNKNMSNIRFYEDYKELRSGEPARFPLSSGWLAERR